MFTGIVQGMATLVQQKSSPKSNDGIFSLRVQVVAELLENIKTGASVSVNGCCLTVTGFSGDEMEFDVIDETLERTNLGLLKSGDRVNIERSMRHGDEIGGHTMSGHVHCTGEVLQRIEDAGNLKLCVRAPQAWSKYLISKGFIGFNGCSLTLGEVQQSQFWVHLIPETRRITNLDDFFEGASVNLEFDQNTVTAVDTLEKIHKTD